MAIAKLILEDVDVNTGEVSILTDIQGSLVDDGQMTAAEVMLRVLLAEVNSPTFRAKVWAEIENLVSETPGASIANDDHNPNTKAG